MQQKHSTLSSRARSVSRRLSFPVAVLAALVLSTACVTSVSNDSDGSSRSGGAAPAAGTPEAQPLGQHHKAMQQLVGEWTFELLDMEKEGTQRRLASGKGTIRAELGGRYLVWNTRSDTGHGHGAGLLGYSLVNKQYEFLWVSGRTTGMPIARGEGVLNGRGITLNIKERDPRTGQLLSGSMLLRAIDLDHFVLDNYALDVTGELHVRRRTSYERVGSGLLQ